MLKTEKKYFVCKTDSFNKLGGYNVGGIIIDLKTQKNNQIDQFLKSIDFDWTMCDYLSRDNVISNSKEFNSINELIQRMSD